MSDPIVAAQTVSAESTRYAIQSHLANLSALDGNLEAFARVVDRLAGLARSVDSEQRLILDPNAIAKKAAKQFAPTDKKLRKQARSVIRRRFGALMLDPGWYNYAADHSRIVKRELEVHARQDRIYIEEEAKRRHREQQREATRQASIAESILDYEALMTRPGLVPLIDGVLFEACIAMLYAPPATFKTFMALWWAVCVALGKPWAGREVKAGPVLYIMAEGSAGSQKRLAALALHLNGGKPIPNLHIYPKAVDLTDLDGDVAELEELNREHCFALIVADTLVKVSGGAEENSSTAMTVVTSSADRIRQASDRTAFLFVAHSGKNGDLRGSNALSGNPDTVLRLEGDAGMLTLEATKQKDIEIGVVGRFKARLIPEHDSLVLESLAPGQGQPQGEHAARVEEALAHFVRAFGETGCTRSQFVDYLTEFEVAKRSAAHDYVGALIRSHQLTATKQGSRGTWLELTPTPTTFPLSTRTTD